MDKKALFGEVDFAVEEALNARISKLDTLELEEWTDEVLKEDAADVNATIDRTVESMGWTPEEYHDITLRMRRNRHTPKGVAI
jgi:hypothetical protein